MCVQFLYAHVFFKAVNNIIMLKVKKQIAMWKYGK